MNKMFTRKKLEYLFEGTFNYINKPKSMSAAKIEGHVNPDKYGFFRGHLYRDNRRYEIAGHLREDQGVSHFLFIVTPYKSINQHCIYTTRSLDAKDFVGTYTGNWYLSFENIDPKLLKDYQSLLKFANNGRVDGTIDVTLKKKGTIEEKV